MVDIQSATAQIRRGEKNKPQDKNMMSSSAMQGDHKNMQQNLYTVTLVTR